MDFRTCTAQVFFQIPWKIWSNLKRIQQNAEIELMKLNYIPRFMGEYFMCHKFEMQHIKSVHRREKEKWQWKRKFKHELFSSNAWKYSWLKSTSWQTGHITKDQKIIPDKKVLNQICIFNISTFGKRKWNLSQTTVHSYYHSANIWFKKLVDFFQVEFHLFLNFWEEKLSKPFFFAKDTWWSYLS